MVVERSKYEVKSTKRRTGNKPTSRITFDAAGRLQVDGMPVIAQTTNPVGPEEGPFRIQAQGGGGPKKNKNCKGVELTGVK